MTELENVVDAIFRPEGAVVTNNHRIRRIASELVDTITASDLQL